VKLSSWLKAILIVILAAVLDIAAHLIGSKILPSQGIGLPPSVFVEKGIGELVALVLLLISFGVLMAVFFRLRENLPYPSRKSGLLYGLSFGGLWFIGVLESTLVLGTSMKYEIFMGLADGIPILLMGVLLGFMQSPAENVPDKVNNKWIVIPLITVFYLVGRYFSYLGLHIDSGITTAPLGNFLWTLAMGIWVGFMYWLLGHGIKGASAIKSALLFGIVVFGSDWLLFTSFLTVFYKMNILDLFQRVFVDIAFVTIGAYFAIRSVGKQTG